ncbi:MAG TPA: hypothetical protein VMB50_09590 [Myxococcales bacterium]|nr:hypothetical protein [Myxococcales bacterium]
MTRRATLGIALGALLAPAPALAQHAVRPKDAEAPVAVPQQPAAPQIEPLVDTPGARKRSAPLGDDEKRPDAGPPPKFKDDLGPDDARAAPVSAPDCSSGCERLLTKRFESNSFTLHVRPAVPRPGKLMELVVEVNAMLDPPDPEYGDRKPITDEVLVAHVEGVGRFLLHPIPRDAGAYGFHLTAPGAGDRSVEITRQDGRPGLEVTFTVPVGQPVPKGTETRDWSPPDPSSFQSVAIAPPSSSDSPEE